MTQEPLVLLIPVYNDWQSLQQLLKALRNALPPAYQDGCRLLLVNDGSPEPVPATLEGGFPATVLHLTHNIGHQKAIAIGLSYAYHHLDFQQLLIMDSDGEDRPDDVASLLLRSGEASRLVVAKRLSRQEGRSFRFFYRIYRLMFYILTGKRIGFGNFMVLTKKDAVTMVHYSEIWNHLAGAILKSGIPYDSITAHRGRRYQGQSKMNFNALLLHGLGAIGVFIERIASRLLLFSLALILVSLLAIGVTMFIKLFTARAIPGWTTTVVSSMLVVLLQSFLLSLFTIFLYLSSQGQRKFIPAHHYMDYVGSIDHKKEHRE